MQTKNAIGNLINRYRAVLKKCNLLNTFGTLAIASAFAMSGAGVASAEVINGKTSGVSITTEQEANNHGASFVADSDDLVVHGDDEDTKEATITAVTGILGTVTIDADTIATTLNVNYSNTDANAPTADVYSDSISFDNTTTNTATMNIGENTTYAIINNGNVNTIDGGGDADKSVLNIDGELLSLTSVDDDSFADLTIGNTAGAIVNVDTNGSLAARTLTLDNGAKLNAAGKTITVENYNANHNTDGKIFATTLVLDNSSTVTADTIELIGQNTDNTYAGGDALQITSGAVKAVVNATNTGISGALSVDGNNITALTLNDWSNVAGNVTVGEGGAFTVDKAEDGTGEAAIAGKLEVSNGAVNINGVLDIDDTATSASKGFIQSGGTVNLAEDAVLKVAGNTGNAASITGGTFSHAGSSYFAEGIVVDNGASLTVKDAKTTADFDSEEADGTLYVGNGSSVKLDNSSFLFVDNAETFDGTVLDSSNSNGTVVAKGTLTNTTLSDNLSAIAGTYNASGDVSLTGDLTVINGITGATSVTTAANSALNFGLAADDDAIKNFFGTPSDTLADLSSTALTANGADVTFNTGKWKVGAVTLTEGDLLVKGGEAETGNITGDDGGINISGGTLKAADVTLSSANGDLTVDGGSLTVTGAFDSSEKAITIGEHQASTVTLSGTVDTQNSTVTLHQLGELVVNFSDVVENNSAKNTWAALNNASTGTLKLNDAAGDMTIDEYATLQTTIIGSSTVNFDTTGLNITGGATLTQADTNKINKTDLVVTADNDHTLNNSGVVVQGIDSTNASADIEVAVGNKTFTMAGGTADGFDLDNGKNVNFTVADNGTLRLGAAGDRKNGTLEGSVDLQANGAALKVVKGDFTVGGITTTTGNAGTIDIQGGTLTSANGITAYDVTMDESSVLTALSDDISVNDVTGGAVTADTGNISVGGVVSGSTLTASAGTIDVTGTISNASLDANGNITTGNTVANSSLTSSNGGITLGGAVSGTSSLSAVAGIIDAGANAVAAKDLEALKFTSNGTVDLSDGAFRLTGTGSTIDGAFTADNMSGTVTDITFGSTATIKNGSSLTFTNAAAGGDITVGDSSDAANGSTVTFNTLNLGTHTLKAASAFTASTPTSVAVGSFDDGSGNTDITGHIETGNNGLVSLGTTDTSILANAVQGNAGGKSLGSSGYTSAMYIHAPVVLDSNGGGLATGTTASNGAVNIAADTLLVVNGQLSEAAISGVDANNSTFAGDVSILHAKQGDYTLFAGSNFTDSTLAKEKVYVDNRLLTVDENIVAADDGSDLKLTIVANTESDVLSNFSDNLGDLVLAYTEAGSGVNNFLDFALSNTNGLTDAQAAAVIEGAAKAPMIIGAPKIALDVATIGSDYAMARTSFAPRVAGAYALDDNGQAQNIASGDNMANGMNVWIMPMYEHASVDGLDSGLYTLDYDTDFYGVAVGADYTWDNSFRLGATLNFGTGDAETKSGSSFSKTENDYDSLGAGLYAGYMFGNFGLSGDFMYTHVKNDIDQKVAGYGTLSAEGDTDVISLGLRAEYKYETAVMDIIPHAGIRYNHVDMDDMTFSGQLTTIADSANIWQLPVGVTFSREIAAESGWNVKPSLDLSLIPAFGDTDMEQSVRFAGVNGLATMNTEIMDELSGRAQVGIEASKGNFYMGLDYAYQGSSNIDAHQVQANFGFKF